MYIACSKVCQFGIKINVTQHTYQLIWFFMSCQFNFSISSFSKSFNEHISAINIVTMLMSSNRQPIILGFNCTLTHGAYHNQSKFITTIVPESKR